MGSYCSFIVAHPDQTDAIGSLCSNAGWTVRFIDDPSQRFWFQGSTRTELVSSDAIDLLRPGYSPGQLLVFECEEIDANNLMGLIGATSNIIEASPSELISLPSAFLIPAEKSDRDSIFVNVFRTRGFSQSFVSMPNLPLAVAMAAKAWNDRSNIYAIHKLSQSYETECITWHSTHPRYGQIFENHTEEYKRHVNTSIAINLAFSAIEEIQLEIRSSSKKVRFNDNDRGEWNPKVLEDVTNRLSQQGVDLSEKINWIIRGDADLVSVEVKPMLGSPAPYADTEVVRDIEVTLPDALHISSFLRNFMTAHRFNETTKFIGPYEVFNVQNLVRRILLSKAGLWRVDTDEVLKHA